MKRKTLNTLASSHGEAYSTSLSFNLASRRTGSAVGRWLFTSAIAAMRLALVGLAVQVHLRRQRRWAAARVVGPARGRIGRVSNRLATGLNVVDQHRRV